MTIPAGKTKAELSLTVTAHDASTGAPLVGDVYIDGEFEGRTRVDICRDNPGWTIWIGDPPGGETAEQVALRTKRVIDRLLTANGDVALFAHGHVLRILATTWLGLAPADGRLLALDTATLSVLGFENETRVVRQWNTPTDEDA